MRPPSRLAVTVIGLALLDVYARWGGPWALTWGATADEVARRMPGDELITRPALEATRAITIHAGRGQVWPWLVEAGTGRAGWYSYDLVDNLGRASADRVIPQLQDLAVGDTVPMTPSGRLGLRVHALDEPASMVWGSPGETTWTWVLRARHDGSTRLVTRFRSRTVAGIPTRLFALPLEIGDAVMMRKMLLTVKSRAENLDV